MRPGVPMIASVPERSVVHEGPKGVPPYTQRHVRWPATLSISFETCCASSRVGAITNASG